MTTFQSSKTNMIDAGRKGKGTSQFSKWVRENYEGKFIVMTSAVDTEGNFSNELLKSRGYEFSGAGADHVERKLLVGDKMWFKAFDSEEAADSEIEVLCEVGI